MKISIRFLIVGVLTCSVLACSKANNIEQSKPFPVGDYSYKGFDKNGVKIVEGLISITAVKPRRIGSEDSPEIEGNWQLNQVGNPEKLGPQVGKGDLIGSITKGQIYINLNPDVADGNIFLNGQIEGNRFHGTWVFSVESGHRNQGTFEATKRQHRGDD